MIEKNKKIDPSEKLPADEQVIQRQRRKQKMLFPLRINSTPVILVPKEKHNIEYAACYNKKNQKYIKRQRCRHKLHELLWPLRVNYRCI